MKATSDFYMWLIMIPKCFSELVPADLERDLKNLYMSLCELLRHFWTSFPPTTPTLEAKAVRMHEALRRFQSARLKPFEV